MPKLTDAMTKLSVSPTDDAGGSSTALGSVEDQAAAETELTQALEQSEQQRLTQSQEQQAEQTEQTQEPPEEQTDPPAGGEDQEPSTTDAHEPGATPGEGEEDLSAEEIAKLHAKTQRRIKTLVSRVGDTEKIKAENEQLKAQLRASSLPNQAKAPDVKPEEQSGYWANQYQRLKETGTATPEQLEQVAARYHSTRERELLDQAEQRSVQRITGLMAQQQQANFVSGELLALNQQFPHMKVKAGGQGIEYDEAAPIRLLCKQIALEQGAEFDQLPPQGKLFVTQAAALRLIRSGSNTAGSETEKLRRKVADANSRNGLTPGGRGATQSTGGGRSAMLKDLQERSARGDMKATERLMELSIAGNI